MAVENEKKWLIATPELSNEFDSYYITSTYLTPPGSEHEKRIRAVQNTKDETDIKFYCTEKTAKGADLQKREENEKEISAKEYYEMFRSGNPYRHSLVKVRTIVPLNDGLNAEIDTYKTDTGMPELNNGFSIMEVELPENFKGEVVFPKGVDVIKDVTNKKEYKNQNLVLMNSFENGIINPKDFLRNSQIIDAGARYPKGMLEAFDRSLDNVRSEVAAHEK